MGGIKEKGAEHGKPLMTVKDLLVPALARG